MSSVGSSRRAGVLRDGWTASVDDYALSCEWALQGSVLMVSDVLGGVKALDGKSGRTLWESSDTHEGGLLATSVNPDGTLVATAGQDGSVLIWEVKSGICVIRVKIGSDWTEHLAWSHDGAKLAVTCSRKVHVINSDGAEIWKSKSHASTVSAIKWSKKNELVTACYGSVTFFDINSSTFNQKFDWQGSLISMVLSPDGDVVACGSQDNSVHFWRRSTANDSMMSGYSNKPSHLDFDHSGALLATGGAEVVTVWSFENDGPEGTTPGQLELHTKPISSLSFEPNGNRLVSGSRDGTIVVWALENNGDGKPTGVAMMTDQVSGVSWRPDGRALAAVDAKGHVTTWRINK